MYLDELIAEIQDLEPADRLEWLVEFSDELPAAPLAKTGEKIPDSCRIKECQTQVYLWVKVIGDKIHLEADVPKDSPLVRGLVAFVVCGLENATVSEVLSLPEDMIAHLGLTSVLGMTRQQGFRGVIDRIKRELRAQTQ